MDVFTVVTAALIVGGIAGGLAAVIGFTDKIVNNYGEVTIDINSGNKQLKVNGGSSLLFTLSDEGIFIPSACGGRGSCGECRVKVLSDIGPHLPTEGPLLTKEEIKENVRLSCQVKVKQDMEIEVPEELFNVQKFQGVIENLVDITHDIKEVYIRLEEPPEISFTAGQYGQLVIPPYGKVKDENQRAYSFSSKPSDNNHMEFLIRLVPGGIGTTWVHEHLSVGTKVEVVAPFGDFKVHETGADMICVAGGSGMAPFKSILFDMLENGQTDRNVWYFFGARSKKDLFYLDMMRDLESKWNKFHFIPALSEPLPEDNWDGETGLITDVLDRYIKEKLPEADKREGYLCGSPGMIDACVDVMTQNGIEEHEIYYDKFA